MTHPADHVYRFRTLDHWARGLACGLNLSPDGGITTPVPAIACPLVAAAPGTDIVLMAQDPCRRLLWLASDGVVRVLSERLPIQIARIGADLAAGATALIWGQRIAWVVTGGDLIRLDARSGDRMGSFTHPGWRVTHAVADLCDGAIVAEERRGQIRLRQIRPDGTDRVATTDLPLTRLAAMARFSARDPVVLTGHTADGWQSLTVTASSSDDGAATAPGAAAAFTPADGIEPGIAVTMTGAARQLFVTPDGRGYFDLAHGLQGPVVPIEAPAVMGRIVDIEWIAGQLYLGTKNGLYTSDNEEETTSAVSASYITPPLHSPPGMRSGWQRADLHVVLPQSARVTIRSRAIDDAAAFSETLRTNPGDPALRDGWEDATASVHFGEDAQTVLRHYLGDQTAEWLALRIDISTSACSAPVELQALDILYPNRSLIEDLPAIYRTRDGSEAQLRRMLAPFQALADEIDDLIGDRLQNLDPDRADGLWAGFLLGWLGHGRFARLPEDARASLLKALPQVLPRRGTLAGLALVIDALTTDGFAIEDAGLGPDIWVLGERGDPAAARLGTDTRAVRGSASGLRLGCGQGLGDIHLGTICLDPLKAAARCSGDVTIRIFGGESAEARIRPFADRIIRDFVPAHTRVRFVYGAHAPSDALERPRPAAGGDHGDHLITLDPGGDRRIGAWRLPDGSARIIQDDPPSLNSAILDGTLVLG